MRAGGAVSGLERGRKVGIGAKGEEGRHSFPSPQYRHPANFGKSLPRPVHKDIKQTSISQLFWRRSLGTRIRPQRSPSPSSGGVSPSPFPCALRACPSGASRRRPRLGQDENTISIGPTKDLRRARYRRCSGAAHGARYPNGHTLGPPAGLRNRVCHVGSSSRSCPVAVQLWTICFRWCSKSGARWIGGQWRLQEWIPILRGRPMPSYSDASRAPVHSSFCSPSVAWRQLMISTMTSQRSNVLR